MLLIEQSLRSSLSFRSRLALCFLAVFLMYVNPSAESTVLSLHRLDAADSAIPQLPSDSD